MHHQESQSTQSIKEQQRSFWLNVLNGAGFNISDVLMNTEVVMVWFLSNLTNSNLLLGSLGPIASAGWFIPQLFLSGWIQQKPRKVGVYGFATVIRLLTWTILALAMWLIPASPLLLVIFMLAFTVMKFAAGIAGIPYLEITAKTVPPHLRGRLSGLRMLTGGVLGLFASRAVSWVLESDLPYPRNYAILVVLGMIFGALAMGILLLIREPAGSIRNSTPWVQQLQRGMLNLRRDANYRVYLWGRSCLMLGSIAIPFYSVLAQRVLNAPAQVAGDYLMALTVTRLLVNYPWGWLADHKGAQWVIRMSALGSAATGAMALALLWIAGSGLALPFPLYLLAYPLFVLLGVIGPANEVSGMNLLMQITPADDSVLYFGFANTFLGVFVLLGGLGGALVDWFGLWSVCALACLMGGVGYVLLGRIRLPQPAV